MEEGELLVSGAKEIGFGAGEGLARERCLWGKGAMREVALQGKGEAGRGRLGMQRRGGPSCGSR